MHPVCYLCHDSGVADLAVKEGPNRKSVVPMRNWILRVMATDGLTISDLAKSTGIPERIFYRIIHESRYINFYKADEILTRLNGPSVFLLYPEDDE